MWWEGPSWLRQSPENNLKAQASDEPADLQDESTKEVRAREQTRENPIHGTVLVNVTQETEPHRSTKLLAVIDCERYSTCIKPFRETVLVLNFVSNLKARRENSPQKRSVRPGNAATDQTTSHLDAATRAVQ